MNLKHPCAETCSGYKQAAEEATHDLRVRLAASEALAERYRGALEKVVRHHSHSSGCGSIFNFPFGKNLVDGCNCGTNEIYSVKVARSALADAPGGEDK